MEENKINTRYDEAENKQGSDDEDFEQLLKQSFLPPRQLSVGEELKATVISFDDEYVFLNMGTRVDGKIRKYELMKNGKLIVNEGDQISVFVTAKGDGVWHCSCRSIGKDSARQYQPEQDPQKVSTLMELEIAYNQNSNVEGTIKSIIKGGFEVQIKNVKTFCPLSQIDTVYCENPDQHLNKTYTFKVIDFAENGNNIVLSRKEFLKHEANKKAERLWEKIEVDSVHKGKVSAVRNYGAFVDIGGIEGLLHISEISYERVKDIEELINVGDEIEVAVINVDRQNRKISLSQKILLEDPWNAAVKELVPNTEIQGRVVRMKTYGAFIELFPGVDGMVHISNLGTDRVHRHPKEVLNINDIVTVRVLEIDKENRKISLTMEKEEKDFSEDLKKLNNEQDNTLKTKSSTMENVLNNALENNE